MRMKTWMGAALALGMAVILSGCSLMWYLLTPDQEDADLVVINDSREVVYAISVSQGEQTETVAEAGGHGLLERGESYGLLLAETGKFTLALSGRSGELLGRYQGDYSGERLYLTLGEGGTLTCETGEEWRE